MCSALLLLLGLSACRDPEPGKTAETGGDSGAGDTDTGDPPPPPIYNESSEGGWVDVRAWWQSTCALSAAGSISCWGHLADGPHSSLPESVTYAAVRGGGAWMGGISSDGVLYYNMGDEVASEDGVIDFDGNILYYCIVFDDGRLDCSGGDSPYGPSDSAGLAFRSFSCGNSMQCGILQDDTLYCLVERPADHGGGRDWLDPPEGSYSQLSCSSFYFYEDGWDFWFDGCCAISDLGKLSCWGAPDIPEPPEGMFTQVSASTVYLCAVRNTGELACWGDPGPRPDPPDRTFVSVDTEGGHTCGITTEGTILCWGDDSFGQATPP